MIMKINRKTTLWALFLLFGLAACSDDEEGNGSIMLTNGTQTSQTIYADETTDNSGGIHFTAAADWTASVIPVTSRAEGGSSVDWLSLSAYSGGPGEYTLTLTLKKNTTGQDRKAKIEIVCGDDVVTITVEQKGTTEDGGTLSSQGKRLVRLEHTSVECAHPDSYDMCIITFEYDNEGRLTEMHDISYVGDSQYYYSDDVYTFTYEDPKTVRLVQTKDHSSPYTYILQLNEAGDVGLMYEETVYPTTTAWRFDYDDNRYLQKVVENNTYELENGEDTAVLNPGTTASTRAFTYARLIMDWKDGNLINTGTDTYGIIYEDFMDWEYTSYLNETPDLDFNVMSSRSLFGIHHDGQYVDIINMLFALRMLGQNSRNLVKEDYANWGYEVEEPASKASDPIKETTDGAYWEPFEYSFTAENYLSRVTARGAFDGFESYVYEDEYIFTYE